MPKDVSLVEVDESLFCLFTPIPNGYARLGLEELSGNRTVLFVVSIIGAVRCIE
jgi:hypothetical protein